MKKIYGVSKFDGKIVTDYSNSNSFLVSFTICRFYDNVYSALTYSSNIFFALYNSHQESNLNIHTTFF